MGAAGVDDHYCYGHTPAVFLYGVPALHSASTTFTSDLAHIVGYFFYLFTLLI